MAAYDVEITLHRSGATPYRVAAESAADAFDTVYQYLAGTWGIPVPPDINGSAIALQLFRHDEYRRDGAHYLIVVKRT